MTTAENTNENATVAAPAKKGLAAKTPEEIAAIVQKRKETQELVAVTAKGLRPEAIAALSKKLGNLEITPELENDLSDAIDTMARQMAYDKLGLKKPSNGGGSSRGRRAGEDVYKEQLDKIRLSLQYIFGRAGKHKISDADVQEAIDFASNNPLLQTRERKSKDSEGDNSEAAEVATE